MTTYRLSAFADEAGKALSTQLAALRDNGIGMIELRNVDGKSCVDLTDEEVLDIRARLAGEGVTLSALGSPCGKYPITEPFQPHLDVFKRALEICRLLGAGRMRMFSFFIPKGEERSVYREGVISRLGQMLELARDAGVELCHENEKGIYGEGKEACLEILSAFGGEMKAVYDPANFAQAQVGSEAFPLIAPYISYMHIKDALLKDGAVVPAGKGDGGVEKILSSLAGMREDTVLTLEPHLRVFDGLKALQAEELTHHYSYPDASAAFRAAADALKEILTRLNFHESKGEIGVWTR